MAMWSRRVSWWRFHLMSIAVSQNSKAAQPPPVASQSGNKSIGGYRFVCHLINTENGGIIRRKGRASPDRERRGENDHGHFTPPFCQARRHRRTCCRGPAARRARGG